MAENHFIPQKRGWDCTYTWSFKKDGWLFERFHTAKFEENFSSPIFEGLLGTQWQLDAFPMGYQKENDIDIFLKWLQDPINIGKMNVLREFQCEEIGFVWSNRCQFTHDKSGIGWRDGTFLSKWIPKSESFIDKSV